MEISARVLREVEFNSSLRGYNTDEVDEFLEQVAEAVDRLQEEARVAGERAEAAERGARDRTGLDDDDSIRRTLVLAQRTADLAVREAQDEAKQITDRARIEAESLVSDARDSAVRITSEAERRLRDEVSRLGISRDELRKEVDTLVSLLGAERERLIETLGAALRYVERSLSPSSDLLSLSPRANSETGADAGAGTGTSAAAPVAEPVADGKTEADVTDKPAPEATGKPAPEARGKGAAERPDKSAAEGADTPAAADPGASPPAPVTSETPPVVRGPAKADGDASKSKQVDDVEAAIAEDAAKAAPAYARPHEPDDYDWDSVIRGSTEPIYPDRDRLDRPTLTALPSIGDSTKNSAAMRKRGGRSSDSPA
ncbi:MAG TPA: DivIVA domain-containing protein [Acidimicrobiales bacterium]|nr:DivIVA domain-containing protein [Acidimicrobiales bacterium]